MDLERPSFPIISLSDGQLASIGYVTVCEARALSSISLVLKALTATPHDEWSKDRRQFDQLMAALAEKVCRFPSLDDKFRPLNEVFCALRESRNFVVHSNWGEDADGNAAGYCYRRETKSDENTIKTAVDDSATLAKMAYELAFETALLIENKAIIPANEEGPGVSIMVNSRNVRF